MDGMSTMRLVALITRADRSIQRQESEKSRVARIMRCFIGRFGWMVTASLVIPPLLMKHRWQCGRRRALSHALQNYRRHYQLTLVEVSIAIGPCKRTWTESYGYDWPRALSALVFVTSSSLTTKLQLTVHRFYERRAFCTPVCNDKSKSIPS